MKLPVRSERGWVQAWVVIKENKTQLDSAGYDRKQMADKLDGEKFGSGRFDIEQLDERMEEKEEPWMQPQKRIPHCDLGRRQQRSSHLSSKPNVMFRHSQL